MPEVASVSVAVTVGVVREGVVIVLFLFVRCWYIDVLQLLPGAVLSDVESMSTGAEQERKHNSIIT